MRNDMLTAGIDLGSTTVKSAIIQDGVFLGSKTSTNGFDLKKASEAVYFQLLLELGMLIFNLN